MKGLILKDFMGMRSQAKLLGIFVLIYGGVSIMQNDTSMLEGVVIVLSMMMVINTFSYDSAYQWDHYILSCPVSRKMLVYSRYAYGLITILGSGAFILAVKLLLVAVTGTEFGHIITTIAMLSLAVIAAAIVMPIMYKFGPEKSRIVLIIIAIIPVMLLLMFNEQLSSLLAGMDKWIENVLWFSPIVAIVLFAISSQVSLAVFRNKEV